jgi:predicted Zn-dependent protease
MRSRFSRIALATALATSLWTSAINIVAAAPRQQQQQTAQTQQTGASQQDSKTKSAPATQEQAKPAASGTLPADEDPNQIGKRQINKGIWAKMSTSQEKEVALGRQLAMEIDREAKFVEDPVITEYVNRVGQNIVLHSDAKVPFTIKVIDSDEVNAFALPGGFFYVNKGLLLAADNEAELAGVMAHEIAHVAARHAVENQAKANAMQYGAIIGSIFLGGIPGMIFQNTAGLGMLAAFMKFSRGAEAEADKLGVQYLYAAGYDPSAMATMFEKLEAKNKKKPGFLSRAFASHPQPPDRRAASIALVARFPEREEYVVSTSEFQRVKARLMRLSNARATTAGDISGGDNGTPGRPTLKRRQPAPDDSTGTPDTNDQKPSDKQPNEPPKLKRNTANDSNDGAKPATQTSQPNSQP